jgi:hypothetical protein
VVVSGRGFGGCSEGVTFLSASSGDLLGIASVRAWVGRPEDRASHACQWITGRTRRQGPSRRKVGGADQATAG